MNFPRAKLTANPEKQPEKNPIIPDSFMKIYIIFEIGFTVVSNAHNGSSNCLLTIHEHAPLKLAPLGDSGSNSNGPFFQVKM